MDQMWVHWRADENCLVGWSTPDEDDVDGRMARGKPLRAPEGAQVVSTLCRNKWKFPTHAVSFTWMVISGVGKKAFSLHSNVHIIGLP